MESKEKSFDELYNLSCEGHVEEKGNLKYLSWAYAWATLLEQDPKATKKVYENSDGSLVWKDPIGGHVKVSVTAFGIERIEYLPVMDYHNNSVPFDNIDSMMVNKTIQRAVTKAIAQFGIGLKLYAGEDLPNDDKQDVAEPKKEEPENSGRKEPNGIILKDAVAEFNRLPIGRQVKANDWISDKYGGRALQNLNDGELLNVLVFLRKANAEEKNETKEVKTNV